MTFNRRDFIKLTAVTGTGAALASCGNPEHQLIRFVPDDDIVPGIAEWKPSVCPLCAAGCGVNVRVMDADFETVRKGQPGVVAIKAAKKLEGQPAHPIGRGGLCARGQAAIQLTYHPDRVQQPMKRSGARGAGDFEPVSWDEAIAEVVSHLDALAGANDQKSLAAVVRPRRSRRLELLGEFLSKYGAPLPIGFELFSDEVLRRANGASFGREQLPTIDLARTRLVLNFGADILGTWNSPNAQSAAYGEMRQGRDRVRGSLVQFEPRMSLTGASADEWVPIKPGTEGVLALGLAHAIDGSRFGDYPIERVAQVTGVPARRIEKIARDAKELRPAVAIVGGAPLAHTNAMFTASAVNALNDVLGAVGQPGGIFFTPQLPSLVSGPLTSRSADLQKLSAQVLFLDDANPVYGAPKAWRVRETLARVPFVVSFASFVDDTSVFADLILPDHTFLESWVDSVPESGSIAAVMNAAGPVMRPLYDTRSTPDVLIEIAGKLKRPVALPWKTYDEALKAAFDKVSPDAWADVEKQGFWAEASAGRQSSGGNRQPAGTVRPSQGALTYTEPTFDGDASAYPFHLLPFASPAFYDGSTAHLPWMQELPDPLTSAMWSSWVEINPQTAAKLNIAQGDLVEISSSQGSVRVPAVPTPGIAPDVIAVPVGQGHEAFTRYATGRGANPVAILAPLAEPETGAFAWAATRVKIARARDADRSLILFAGEMRENPHEGDVR